MPGITTLIKVNAYNPAGQKTYHRYHQAVEGASYLYNYVYTDTFTFDDLDRMTYRTYQMRAPEYGVDLQKTDLHYQYSYTSASERFPTYDSIFQYIFGISDTMSITTTNLYTTIRTFDSDGYPASADYYTNGLLHDRIITEYDDGLIISSKRYRKQGETFVLFEEKNYSYNSNRLLTNENVVYTKAHVKDITGIDELYIPYDNYFISDITHYYNEYLNLDSTVYWKNNIFNSEEDILENQYEYYEKHKYIYTLSTSLNDPIVKPNLLVYPNPSNQFLNIQYFTEQPYSYLIYNNKGVLIEKNDVKSTSSTTNIDISTLTAGNYIITIINNNGEKTSINFIKL